MNLRLWNNDMKDQPGFAFITLPASYFFLCVSEQFKSDLFQSILEVENQDYGLMRFILLDSELERETSLVSSRGSQ
jgi:hypothetical protein